MARNFRRPIGLSVNLFILLKCTVDFMTLDVDRAEGPGRTKIFARSATNAELCVDHRDFHFFSVGRFRGDHAYRSCGAMAGAVPALHAFGQGQTVFFDPYGMSDLY